jgi:RHS repeat-associated protein
VDISAYGTQDYSVDPLMRVTVNGVVAGTWDVGAAQTLALNQSVPQGDPATYYTIGDQVGTAQLELSSGGWPVWRGEFGPYGQEYDSETTENKFKFTGKERDTESGLDYFGARYYASSMGRWMSPDWADKPEAVPYSDLDNPQSLNLYDYVNNNPLSKADPDGHCCWDKAKQWVTEHPRTSQAVGGVAKVAVGVGLVATIAGGDVPGSVVGVGMVVSGTLSAVGSVVSGVTDVAGAATNTNVEAAQKGLDGVSNVPALVTSAATGNLAAGAAVGTLADAGQLAAKPMEALKNPATMADAAKTVSSAVDLGKSAASAVHNTLSPGPPPAPKPPAPPSCSTAGACK